MRWGGVGGGRGGGGVENGGEITEGGESGGGRGARVHKHSASGAELASPAGEILVGHSTRVPGNGGGSLLCDGVPVRGVGARAGPGAAYAGLKT